MIHKTKAGEALYKRETRSIYSYSEGKFALTSDGNIPSVGLLTDNEKSCGWDIFDVPIANIGSIQELVGHNGEINL